MKRRVLRLLGWFVTGNADADQGSPRRVPPPAGAPSDALSPIEVASSHSFSAFPVRCPGLTLLCSDQVEKDSVVRRLVSLPICLCLCERHDVSRTDTDG
eukprot:3479380-Rhodomonas_salina.7